MKNSTVLFTLIFALGQHSSFAQTNLLQPTGNVGVGTTTPKAQFQIGDNFAFQKAGYTNFIGHNAYFDGKYKRIKSGRASQISFENGGQIKFNFSPIGGNENSDIEFVTGITIQPNGFVGLGSMSAPSERLDVDGNIKVRGNIHIDGSDFKLGIGDGRPQGTKLLNRALVHSDLSGGSQDKLVINYDGDFEGGVQISGTKLKVDGIVGIGGEDPNYNTKLFVNQTDNTTWGARIINSGINGQGVYIRCGNSSTNSNLEILALLDGNNNPKFMVNNSGFARIYGKLQVGNVSNTPGDYSIYAGGGILTEKIRVAKIGTSDWADYVFENGYKLMPLKELEVFIQTNRHLPNIPSSQEVAEHGIDLAQINAKLLGKVEELTLHLIEQQKQIDDLKKQNDAIMSKLNSAKN